jgi:hypothetical protein
MVLLLLQGFVDDYLLMVHACAERDGPGVVQQSIKLGFLTGERNVAMPSLQHSTAQQRDADHTFDCATPR